MKKLIVLCAVALTALLLVAVAVGCQQRQPEEQPNLAIMVESNIVEAGSSFMVTGSNLNPQQKIWVEWDYRTSYGGAGCTGYCEPAENGTIHAVIHVPEDIVPGDYEVEVYMGKHLDDRELIVTLPIHIQAKAK